MEKELLAQLLQLGFYWDPNYGGLTWMYQEDVTIKDEDRAGG